MCAVLIDETTDVTVTAQLIIYFRYLSEGKVVTSFGGIVDIPNGSAKTIFDKTVDFMTSMDLNWKEKLRAFGSDGASVMVGKVRGVAALFIKEIPNLVPIHCICHRLALSGKDSCAKMPYAIEFFSIVDQLNRFYKYSAVRTSGLQKIQEAFDTRVKLSKAIDTRWLSKGRAVTNLKNTLPAVLTSLSREASEWKDADALGLHQFMSKRKFFQTLYFMCDIMPELNKLAKMFQADNFDYTRAKFHIENTKSYFARLLQDPHQAKNLQNLDHDMDTILKDFLTEDRGREAANFDFDKDLYRPYLNALTESIDNRFPATEIMEAFSMFDPSNTDTSDAYDNGKNCLISILSKSENDPTLYFDHSQAEVEWSILCNELTIEYNEKAYQARKCQNVLLDVLNSSEMYPTLSKIAGFGLILPLNTAACERGFSQLKLIKTPHRNRLKQSTLDNLMMIATEGPTIEDFDYGKAATHWAKLKKRKIKFS